MRMREGLNISEVMQAHSEYINTCCLCLAPNNHRLWGGSWTQMLLRMPAAPLLGAWVPCPSAALECSVLMQSLKAV